MQILSAKIILATTIALVFISCNDSKKSKYKVDEVKLESVTQTVDEPAPPPPPPPGVEMIKPELKCFVSDGLNYKTTVWINFADKYVAGSVVSEELESGKIESKSFGGTINGDQLSIAFTDDPPAIGAASEWTNRPWTLKKRDGKDVLHIFFKAKNYETNKWEIMKYEFEASDCN